MQWIDRCATFTLFALALTVGATSCNPTSKQTSQTQSAQPEQAAQSQPSAPPEQAAQTAPEDQNDPAAANLAPVAQTAASAAAPAAAAASAPEAQAPAAPEQAAPSSAAPRNSAADQAYSEAAYNPPPAEYAPEPPPPLPEYEQPPIPEAGYIWTPGHWRYAPDGYYWVPGAWTAPPYAGALWTPGYWGFRDGRYAYYHGYWGRYIGYYGGVNYGFGYVGRGYQGGYWQGNEFNYNRSVNNIRETDIVRIHVYNRTVTNYTTYNHVSYNGGPEGVRARPTPAEVAAFRSPHTPPMAAQTRLAKESMANHAQYASVNKGRPEMIAASKPIPADKGIKPAPVMHPPVMHPPVMHPVEKTEVHPPKNTIQPSPETMPKAEGKPWSGAKKEPAAPGGEQNAKVKKPMAKAETPTRQEAGNPARPHAAPQTHHAAPSHPGAQGEPSRTEHGKEKEKHPKQD